MVNRRVDSAERLEETIRLFDCRANNLRVSGIGVRLLGVGNGWLVDVDGPVCSGYPRGNTDLYHIVLGRSHQSRCVLGRDVVDISQC